MTLLSRLRHRWLALVALVSVVVLTCGPSSRADVPAPWPGLPPLAIPAGWGTTGYLGSWGNGLSEVARARQWLRIPAQAVTAGVLIEPRVNYRADDPQDRDFSNVTAVSIYLSSPGRAEQGYGIGLPVTARTVAFGAIPVQVGLQLEQLRGGDGVPIPLHFEASETVYRNPQQVRPGTTATHGFSARLSGQVRVRLTSLTVDGVDTGLQSCLSGPIDLDLRGNASWVGDQLTDPTMQAFPKASTTYTTWLAARGIATLNGGAVVGHVDIPPFSRCLTRVGEDLSPLLTNSISGPENAVTVGIAAIQLPNGHRCATAIPGTTIPGPRGPFLGNPVDCDPDYGPPIFDYPARTNAP